MTPAAIRPVPVANPWLWMAVGLAISGFEAFLSLVGWTSGPAVGAAVAVAVFCVGIAVAIRIGTSVPAVLTRGHGPLLIALIVFQSGVILLTSWVWGCSVFDADPFAPTRSTSISPPPVRLGVATIIWLLVAPAAFAGIRRCWAALQDAEWSASFESSALLMAAAVATLASGFALASLVGAGSGDGEPSPASSLAFFLSVLTAFVAAVVPLPIVSQTMRRAVISGALLCHFGAIVNATMAAPPSSWLLGQLWTRFSRPYLEFMYLNNAYHFYSPDPGPASYLWFRIFYDTGLDDPDTGERKLEARWFKIPDIDAEGNHGYRVALEYQRYLSLTEQVISSESSPPLYYRGPDGKMKPTENFASRILNSPDGDVLKREWKGEVVGGAPLPLPRFVLSVPFHPFVPNDAQYMKPTHSSLRMFESYVQHVARVPHPTRNFPVHSIKVYRVTHMIPPWTVFVTGLDPADPEFYRPYYMGEYLPTGKLKEPEEPLRYWLLPILRDNTAFKNSPIKNYAAMHAGDPLCVYLPLEKRWVELKEEKR